MIFSRNITNSKASHSCFSKLFKFYFLKNVSSLFIIGFAVWSCMVQSIRISTQWDSVSYETITTFHETILFRQLQRISRSVGQLRNLGLHRIKRWAYIAHFVYRKILNLLREDNIYHWKHCFSIGKLIFS